MSTPTWKRDAAVAYVQRILGRYARIKYGMADVECSVELWGADDTVPGQVVVAEVDWHNAHGGSTFMQSDLPLGLAVCAQVERWLMALMIGDTQLIQEERQTLAYLLGEEPVVSTVETGSPNMAGNYYTNVHPNHQKVIDALAKNPKYLIRHVAAEIVALGALSEWDSDLNNSVTGGIATLANVYELPRAYDQGEEELAFYGPAAHAMGAKADMPYGLNPDPVTVLSNSLTLEDRAAGALLDVHQRTGINLAKFGPVGEFVTNRLRANDLPDWEDNGA